MAVRHGYGKVAGTDALVFAYDTGDTINSYKGKPATNIATAIQSRGGDVSADPSDLPTVPKSVASAVYCSSKINGSTNSWESLFQYNTSFNVPNGQRFTVSAWVYIPEGKVNNRFNFNCSVNGVNTGLTVGCHDVPTGRWVKIHGHYLNSTGATVSVVTTRLETYTAAEWTGNSISCWAINFMVEQSADIPSGYTGAPATALGTTRSITQGLLDLTGNNSIDLTNVSFNSNAQMTFDGSDDYVNLNSVAPLIAGGDFSLEAMIKGPTQDHKGIIPINTSSGGNRALFLVRHASMGIYDGGTWYIGNIDVDDNNWHHVMLSYIRSTKKVVIYVDGEVSLDTTTNNMITIATDDRISVGQEWDGSSTSDHFNGDIPIVKIYNRALTAGEVKNNYSHYKNRFGI